MFTGYLFLSSSSKEYKYFIICSFTISSKKMLNKKTLIVVWQRSMKVCVQKKMSKMKNSPFNTPRFISSASFLLHHLPSSAELFIKYVQNSFICNHQTASYHHNSSKIYTHKPKQVSANHLIYFSLSAFLQGKIICSFIREEYFTKLKQASNSIKRTTQRILIFTYLFIHHNNNSLYNKTALNHTSYQVKREKERERYILSNQIHSS